MLKLAVELAIPEPSIPNTITQLIEALDLEPQNLEYIGGTAYIAVEMDLLAAEALADKAEDWLEDQDIDYHQAWVEI